MYEYEFAGKEASPEGIKKLEDRLMKTAKEKMTQYLDKVTSAGKIKVFPRVLKGQPVTEILTFQKNTGIDLIVISSLGHGGLAEYFTGSVARNILKGATCPVLLTKG